MRRNLKRKQLIKLLIVVIILLASSIILILSLRSARPDEVVAKINGQKIYYSQIEKRVKELFLPGPVKNPIKLEKLPKELLEALAKDVFIQEELDKRIQKAKFLKRPEIKEKIENYVAKVARQEYLEFLFKDKINEENIKVEYTQMVEELNGKEEVNLQLILLPDKKVAIEIREKIEKGGNFGELARLYSKDVMSAKNGGNTGYILEDNLPPELYDAISSLKKNQLKGPIETKYGWYIVKLLDSRSAEMPSFEVARTSVIERIKQDEAKELFSEIVNSAKVEILITTKNGNKPNHKQ